MPNFGTIAICPYFLSEDALSVKCEGVVQSDIADVSNNFRFANKDKKKEWLKKYCETHHYLKCPYAEIVENSYNSVTKNY